MNRYSVQVNIGVSARTKKEAREKVQAMLTDGYYKGKYLRFGNFDKLKTAPVERLPF